MQRFVEYAVFFVVVVLLQVFLFGNLDLSVYIHPLVYVVFILLLPMQMPAVAVLLLGFVTGLTVDLMTGDGGLNTIASTATAFARPLVLSLFAGRESVRENGAPLPENIGTGKFMRYTIVMVLLQCVLYFVFESFTWRYFHLTLLRIVLSAAVTVTLVYFSRMLLPAGYAKSGQK